MAFCLTKDQTLKFKQALKSGEIDPFKLADMSSEQRRGYFEKVISAENAKQVNSLFESKLLLKNQQAGMITWAKKVAGISPQVKRDLISRIEKMDSVLDPEGVFLEDLASTRLGIDVTQNEAKTISDLSEKRSEAKASIPESDLIGSPKRMKYGLYDAVLKDYIGKLKLESQKVYFREQRAKYLLSVPINTVSDLARTIQTAYDNSLWGRQLISALTNPRFTGIWVKRFLQSWKIMGQSLGGKDPMLAINPEVYSRPNAVNGKYSADPAGYGLGIISEEVYASQLPAKIPVLGRFFKASEAAFNGGAKLVRADIADITIKAAETARQNVLDTKVAGGLGSYVTSITGRGSAGAATGLLGKVFYAPRFYTAEINQLTAHVFDPRATSYVRKEAAKNLLINLGVTSLVMALAKALDPDSIDHEKKLGKIKIWGRWVDITGGKAAFVNLAVKMSEKIIDGLQRKTPEYGETTGKDLLVNFASGKLNVIGRVLNDVSVGEMYGGKPVTFKGEMESLFQPINLQTAREMVDDPNSSNRLGSNILEFLGLSTSSSSAFKKDWSINPTKELKQFEEKVGEGKFEEANDNYNRVYNEWYTNITTTSEFKNLSDESKEKLITKAKEEIKQQIFEEYDFKYKTEVKSQEQKEEEKEMEKLLPGKISASKPLNKFIARVNKVLDSISKTASASEEKITSVEIQGDKLAFGVTDSRGNFKLKYRDVDSDLTIAQEIGRVLARVGEKVGIGEKNISEKFGYTSKEQRLQEAVDYQKAMLNQQNKDPFVEKGYIKSGGGYYKKSDNGEYTFVDKDKIPSSVLKRIGEDETFQKEIKIVDKESTVTPYDKEIGGVFGDDWKDATRVLRYTDEKGVIKGENTGFQTGPEVDIPNNDGSIDRGLYRINSNTFADFHRRKKSLLQKNGITSYRDMYEPTLNIKMAKIIYDEQGWGAWYAAPPDLR